MIKPKLHLIKYIHSHSNILVLGPIKTSKARLKRELERISPTLIIAVDGGANQIKLIPPSYLKLPKIIVGDGDSLTSIINDVLLEIRLPIRKDFSDLSFVLKELKRPSALKKLSLVGFSSLNEKRPDHFLFNLGEVENLCHQKNIPISMDESFVFLPAGQNSFIHNGLFSLIALRKGQIILSGKCEYKLKQWTSLSPLSSLGLSNKAFGAVKIKNTKSIILYLAGNKNN